MRFLRFHAALRGSSDVLALLLFGMLIRLLVASYIFPYGDFGVWVLWGEGLREYGLAHFFDRFGSDRLPGGILYLLWFLALTKHVFPFLSNELLYKLPAHIADLVLASVLFRHVGARWGRERGLVAGALYLFNPFTWFISSVWAQMDAVQALFLVLAVMAVTRGHVVVSATIFTYIFLFKPHSIVVAPLLLVILWLRRTDIQSFIRSVSLAALSATGALWLLSFPFSMSRLATLGQISFVSFLTEPLLLVWERYWVAYNLYPYTSLRAFNIWSALAGDWQPDNVQFLGVSYRLWGIALFLLFSGTLLVALLVLRRSSLFLPAHYCVSAALLMLFAFTFLTRAHDRHIFPFFGLFAFGLFMHRAYLWLYVLMTTLWLAELTAYYQPMWGVTTVRPIISQAAGELLSFIPVLISVVLLYTFIETLRGSGRSSYT